MKGNSYIRKRRRYSAGFTLTEVLVVIAIILILAGVGVPSFISIRKSLHHKRLDEAAHSIFLTAQSQMSQLKASGALKQLSGTSMGTTPPADFPSGGGELWTNTAAASDYYYLTKDQAGLYGLLPLGALDASFAQGNFYIEYNQSSGMVYGVFFLDEELPLASVPSITNYADLNPYRDRDRRRSIDPAVGYYGGAYAAGGSQIEKPADPVFQVVNGEELYILFIPPAGTNEKYNLTVSDGTSSVLYEDFTDLLFTLPPHFSKTGEQYKILLDSLDSGFHFHEIFNDPANPFTPGRDLTITLTARGSGSLSIPAYSAKTVNSLFAGRADAHVLISCQRHLQNLDIASSGVADEITSAEITQRITWSRPELFASINNVNLADFNGKGNAVSKLNAPLFHGISPLSGTKITGVTLTDTNIFIPASSPLQAVGVLANSLTNTAVSHCYVYAGPAADLDNPLLVKGNQVNYIGGLIGYAKNCTVDYSLAALTAISGSGTTLTHVGGLIGYAEGTSPGSMQITRSYAAIGYWDKQNTDAWRTGSGNQLNCGIITANALTGGLLGEAKNCTLENVYATGNIATAAQSTGGMTAKVTGTTISKNAYSAFTFTGSAAAVRYGFSPALAGASNNNYYLKGSSSNPAGQAGTALEYEQLKTTMTALSGWQEGNPATTKSYGQADTSITPAGPGAYPFARVQHLYHYGDWPGTEDFRSLLVYYEQYQSGAGTAYGFYAEYKDQNNQPAVLDTLKNDLTVINDGYGMLTARELTGNQYQYSYYANATGNPTANATETYAQIKLPVSAQINGADRSLLLYTLKNLPGPHFATSHSTRYYTKITVDQEVYWYNPNFAKTVVISDTLPVRPAASRIRTARQFTQIGELQAKGYWSAAFIQDRSINYLTYTGISGLKMKAIGYNTTAGQFSGSYNGSNYTIVGTDIDVTHWPSGYRNAHLGLFGQISKDGKVENLTLEFSGPGPYEIKGTGSDIGIFVGHNKGLLSNLTLKLTAPFTVQAGGIDCGGFIGSNNGLIKDTAFLITGNGSLTVKSTSLGAGGFMGDNSGIIQDTVFDASGNGFVSVTGDGYVSGFVSHHSRQNVGTGGIGVAAPKIENIRVSFAVPCTLKSTASAYLGGFIGNHSEGVPVVNVDFSCSSDLTIQGVTEVGGFIGRNASSRIDRITYDISGNGTAQVKGTSNEVGGFIGISTGSGASVSNVTYRIATPYTITGTGDVGGFIGQNTIGKVDRVTYVTSGNGAMEVKGSGNDVGGFIGNTTGSGSSISNVTYDISAPYTITGNLYVGAFIGHQAAASAASNIAVLGRTNEQTVSGANYVGGFTGYNYADITNCAAAGWNVSTTAASGSPQLGGFIGHNAGGRLTNCSAVNLSPYGSVGKTAGTLDAYAGGLIGYNSGSGTVTSCYAVSSLISRTPSRAGGLIANNAAAAARTTNSYAMAQRENNFIGLIGSGTTAAGSCIYFDGTAGHDLEAINSYYGGNFGFSNPHTPDPVITDPFDPLLSDYPFPAIIKHDAGSTGTAGYVHYGNWPVTVSAGLVYYERYENGQYGLLGQYSTDKNGYTEIDTFTAVPGTAAQTVVQDGYGILLAANSSAPVPEIFYRKNNESALTAGSFESGPPAPVTIDGKDYQLYPIADSAALATSDFNYFYSQLVVSAGNNLTSFWFNPSFAQTVKTGTSRPARSGAVSIRTARQFTCLGQLGSQGYWEANITYSQDRGIDYPGYGDSTLTIASIGYEGKPFRGIYRGNRQPFWGTLVSSDHRPAGPGLTNNVGIFGYLDATAVVTEMDIRYRDRPGQSAPYTVSGQDNVGLLAGTNKGTITDISLEISGFGVLVEGQSNVGGLIGLNAAKDNPLTKINVRVTGGLTVAGTGITAGGLIGESYSSVIDQIRFTTTPGAVVTVTGVMHVGGFAGFCHGAQNGAFTVTDVTYDIASPFTVAGVDSGPSKSEQIGGMFGSTYSYGSIDGVTLMGRTTDQQVTGWADIGGFVGRNFSRTTISNCAVAGIHVSSSAPENTASDVNISVGGFVGSNRWEGTRIVNCSAVNLQPYGSVTAAAKYANIGGFAGENNGYNQAAANRPYIASCYALSDIICAAGSDPKAGSLVGYNYKKAALEHSYALAVRNNGTYLAVAGASAEAATAVNCLHYTGSGAYDLTALNTRYGGQHGFGAPAGSTAVLPEGVLPGTYPLPAVVKRNLDGSGSQYVHYGIWPAGLQ